MRKNNLERENHHSGGVLVLGTVMMFLVLLCLGNEQRVDAQQTVYLTIAYCPTLATGAGAVVSVDVTSGNWEIVGKFQWPSAVFGCTVDQDTIVTFDPASSNVYILFEDTIPLLITSVSVTKGDIVKKYDSKSAFWTGFENMLYSDSDSSLVGLSGDVTENGFCSDGCFMFGSFDLSTGKYTKLQDLPFKAMQDDSHYFDATNSIYYVQGSYDLRPPGQRCAPNDSDECLLAIDATTGALISSNYTQWVAYKYSNTIGGPDGSSILTWVEGFTSLCQHPFNDFLFAWVNLQNASAVPIACIPQDVTVDMDEWIASFSSDGSLFATGSGDAETGIPQLLVFDTTTAQLVVNTTLPGLGAALGAKDNLFDIWSVDFD